VTDLPPSPASGPIAINGRHVSSLYPVVIVGGGPTGLSLANLLSRYGTYALLVERNATTVQEPRAVSIDDESLRTMQAAGVIDRVMPDIVAGYGSEYYGPAGDLFLKVEPSEEPYGYPRRNAFRQPLFESQLREALVSSETVDALFGWTLESFEQVEENVIVHLKNAAGQRHMVRCAYLVGADGAKSPVRGALGLRLDGETFEEKWLIVDLEDSPTLSRETMVFCNTRRPCIALPGPNATRRFEFKLLTGESPDDMVSQERVEKLLSDHGVHPGSRISRKVVYTFHARVAPQWSSGRVFLAGDACHLTPPFAGQGMNSCIRDAHNLAWKLAWVTGGILRADILKSYESERRDHVREMIGLALRMGRIMGPRNAAIGFVTRSLFHLLGCWPRARDYFAQMKYKPKPRFREGFLLPDGKSVRATSVGRLLPQPQVLRADGSLVLLDEIMGNGFALVALTENIGELSKLVRKPALARLQPKMVAVLPPNAAVPDIVHEDVDIVTDPSGVLADAAGQVGDAVFLIRPDRYVLANFALEDAAEVADNLANLLGASPGKPVLSRLVA